MQWAAHQRERTQASVLRRVNPVSGPVQAELWLEKPVLPAEKPVLGKEKPWLPAL
jgi:hypothetical protein